MIIGSFGDGAIEQFYKRGFEKCGVNVDTYASVDQYYQAIAKNTAGRLLNKLSPAIFYKKINEQLLSFMEGRKYEVVLVFKGMELYRDTVKQLKRHAGVLVNYNCDHPFKFYSAGSGNKNVLDSIREYDVHFSYSGNITEQLKKDFQQQAYCIPFGYDKYTSGSGHPDTRLYNGRFLFIGAYDKQRTAALDQLNTPFLDIYGDAKWRTRNLHRPNIVKAYRQRPLYGSNYIDAVSNAAGIINLLREQNINENSHNMRTFEVPGYGGLLISQRTTEQQEYFRENEEAVYFASMDELRDKIDFLRKNPRVATNIQRAGHEKSIRCKYDYDERSRELLAYLAPYVN